MVHGCELAFSIPSKAPLWSTSCQLMLSAVIRDIALPQRQAVAMVANCIRALAKLYLSISATAIVDAYMVSYIAAVSCNARCYCTLVLCLALHEVAYLIGTVQSTCHVCRKSAHDCC